MREKREGDGSQESPYLGAPHPKVFHVLLHVLPVFLIFVHTGQLELDALVITLQRHLLRGDKTAT
jgi:hypothetical protein